MNNPRIKTQKELKTWMERFNKELKRYNVNWYYRLAPRKGCGYSALVRYINGVGERKTICGMQGLSAQKMFEYMLDDFEFFTSYNLK